MKDYSGQVEAVLYNYALAHKLLAENIEHDLELQARIESLEAERDIWRERAIKGSEAYRRMIGEPIIPGTGWSDPPTPSEIAARVQQKRKEP